MAFQGRPVTLTSFGAEQQRQEVLQDIIAARGEFEAARSYFNFVTEPDLVEQAILRLAAAERRYDYAWRQARLLGVRVPNGRSGLP